MDKPSARDWDRWIGAHAALCRGDFAAADAIAAPLAEGSADPRVRAAALISLASSARQTGRYPQAKRHDEAARALASEPVSSAHALIGLAADFVGLGDERECAALLVEAAAIAPLSDARVQTRLAWVRCEHALLTGAPREAAAFAREALRYARRLRSGRHRAKSLLFLGVALDAAGDRRRAVRVLRRALHASQGRPGRESILEVARQMLGRA